MMEIDHAVQAEDDAFHAPKIDGVFSIEDFLGAEAEARHAALKAERSATAGQNRTAPSSINAINSIQPAGPVALGSQSSKHTVDLHAKYQALGIPQPMFTFHGSSDRGWSGEVSFPGLDADELQDIKDDTIYSSKKEAKEGLSKQALEILVRLEEQGKIMKVEAAARVRTSQFKIQLHDTCQKMGLPYPIYSDVGSTASGWSASISFLGLELDGLELVNQARFSNKKEAREAVSKQALDALETAESQGKLEKFGKAKGSLVQAPREKEEPGPNYTGQLLEYQRATGAPQPTYTDYRVGSLFTCQVTLEAPHLKHPQTFGSLETTRPSKKAARQEAARCAVEHFQSQGLWPDDNLSASKGIKKRKLQANSTPELLPTGSPSTPKKRHQTSTIPSPCSPSSYSSPSLESFPQRVARLAHSLSLGTPEWRYTYPTALCAPDFHTVACYFSNGGVHAGPIGEVRNILGKKKAKEECARLTLSYLEEVHRYRMECGRRLMEGVKGGEEVVSGGLGRAREGEVEEVGENKDGEESDVEFEDAVEELVAET